MGPCQRNRSAHDRPDILRAHLAGRIAIRRLPARSTPPTITPTWPAIPTRNLPSGGKTRRASTIFAKSVWGFWSRGIHGCRCITASIPATLHDSKHFESVMDDMFGMVCGLNKTKERLTVVIDKGMNADDNYAWIDEHSRIHFITTYSTYFAQDLAATPLIASSLPIFSTIAVLWRKERRRTASSPSGPRENTGARNGP